MFHVKVEGYLVVRARFATKKGEAVKSSSFFAWDFPEIIR